MLNLNIISQAFLVLVLLLGVQGGATHSLRHAFAEHTQQQNKHTPAAECEQCISYAQYFGSLKSAELSFDFNTFFSKDFTATTFLFRSRHSLTAAARGPPIFQSSV